jgi:hypothetical protein
MPAASPASDPPNVLKQGKDTAADVAGTGPDGLSAKEESQLGALLDKRQRARAGGTTRLKIDSDHAEVTYGGVTVGRDWTEVPSAVVAGLVEGAADAGVQIIQDQES